MNKETIEYITNRANESETGSIKAVSCPDIRALLEERAALLEGLKIIMNNIEWQGGMTYKIKDGNLEAARAAIMKAEGE